MTTTEPEEVTTRRGPLGLLRAKFLRDTKGEMVFPLTLLTAIYFFDEFDTAAFSTLAPDIKNSFHLTDNAYLLVVGANVSVIVLLAVPVGYWADRVSRVRLVIISGVLAGFFSLATGLATSFAMLTAFRFGNGLGVLANVPVHNSLIADYYTPDARPTSFATHTNAVYIANILGPAIAGIAGATLGWRAAFFILFVPILITTVIATRLHEPVRGGTDKPGQPAPEHDPPKFVEAARTLWRIPTLRRSFWASIPLGAGVLPLVLYLSLYYERTYHLGPFQRGLILAANAACTYAGVQRGGKLTPSWLAKGMGVPLERVGMVFALVAVGIVLIAASPWLALTIVIGLVTNYVIGFFFAPLAAVQALVSPARERSLSFSLGAIFLVAGVLLFAISGLGTIADSYGLRWGLVVTAPFWVISGYIAYTAGQFVTADVAKNFA